MNVNFDLLSTATLETGSHAPGNGTCAMEALALAAGLPHTDAPACTDLPLARAFQRVNDWSKWTNDEDRTAFLRPFMLRLGRLAVMERRAPAPAYGFAAADLACRVFATAALDRQWPDHAARLRALGMIVDRESALTAKNIAAAAAAADAAYAAADADAAAYAAADADAAAYAGAYAADADAAADAAYAAAYAADADAAYREMAAQLLTRLLDVCEAGCWPVPGEFTAEPLLGAPGTP